MNIMTIIILMAILQDELPELPELSRANRRANRDKAIARNRALYHALCGRGIWFENQDQNGDFVSYHRGKVNKKSQHGRWDDFHFGGHRRFAKWEKDYYDGRSDFMSKLRYREAMKDFFEE